MDLLYKEILENLDEGVYFVDTTRKITYWNKAAEKITGYKSGEVVGSFCYDNILKHVDNFGNKLCINGCPLHLTIHDGNKRSVEVYLFHKNGHRVRVFVRTISLKNTEGIIIGAIEIFNSYESKVLNVLEEKAVNDLKELAYKDQLTSLFNRQYMYDYIQLKLLEYEHFKKDFAIIFIDIDHFKNINDEYGHDIGDEVIKMVANTLKNYIRTDDIAVRWGGEEFILLCSGISDHYLNEFADLLKILVSESGYNYNNESISVTISIGATKVKAHDTKDKVINRADQLMYESKKNGRNMVTIG